LRFTEGLALRTSAIASTSGLRGRLPPAFRVQISREMSSKQSVEERSVVPYPKVKELVDNHFTPKVFWLA